MNLLEKLGLTFKSIKYIEKMLIRKNVMERNETYEGFKNITTVFFFSKQVLSVTFVILCFVDLGPSLDLDTLRRP